MSETAKPLPECLLRILADVKRLTPADILLDAVAPQVQRMMLSQGYGDCNIRLLMDANQNVEITIVGFNRMEFGL